MTALQSPRSTITTAHIDGHAPGYGAILRTGLPAVLIASASTMAVAAVGHAAGISLDLAGEPIPVLGFGVLTAVFSTVGVLLAVAVSRWSRRPRVTFLRVTLGLTALSLVPDIMADVAGSTRALLMLTHIVAAGIMIPALSRRLRG